MRILCSWSTTIRNANPVATIEESTATEEIMNDRIIWSRAACVTDAPPSMEPVIVPGIAIMPITLQECPSANANDGRRVVWADLN